MQKKLQATFYPLDAVPIAIVVTSESSKPAEEEEEGASSEGMSGPWRGRLSFALATETIGCNVPQA